MTTTTKSKQISMWLYPYNGSQNNTMGNKEIKKEINSLRPHIVPLLTKCQSFVALLRPPALFTIAVLDKPGFKRWLS